MVRQMMHDGADARLGSEDLSALRATVSVGEPWTHDAWEWFFRHVCRGTIPILNYAGGTECGGAILIGSFMRGIAPCSFSHPVPGAGVDVVDPSGRTLAPGEIGELVMRRPSIGLTRGLWKDRDRYLDSYWRVIPATWVQGDLASRDDEGLWYLHGRSDDTIKVAGKRTGPSEIEGILMATGLVSDAAVVGIPDPVTGSALACVCVPSGAEHGSGRLERVLSDTVVERMGAAFRLKRIVFTADLPRTRNQKIVRRVVRAVLTGTSPGDVSSLANPESLAPLARAVGHEGATAWHNTAEDA
jgi:acetyl-CoA synthetase